MVLDAREPVTGGVRQTIIGLAHGLSRLGGEDEYLFLVRPGFHAWLEPYLGGRCRLLPLSGGEANDWRQWLRRRVPPGLLERLATNPARALLPIRVPESDGTVERAAADVVHLSRQAGFLTTLPTIYVPQDVQHVHLPELFGLYERRWRGAVYPTLARRAAVTVSPTRAGRADLVTYLGVPSERVYVIGYAPVLDAYERPDEAARQRLRRDLRLPERFALYPAQTFAHKNHLGLLEALALLRDEGLVVPLVCVGGQDHNQAAIARRAAALRLEEQVRFLGYVSPFELHGLYDLALAMVFPSLFEGFGMPVLEAFRAGVPVACSDIPPLAEITSGAAVRFDPRDRRAMAAAIRKVWTDPALREGLATRGTLLAAGETWEGVARRYRTLYRLAAGRALDREERDLLASMR